MKFEIGKKYRRKDWEEGEWVLAEWVNDGIIMCGIDESDTPYTSSWNPDMGNWEEVKEEENWEESYKAEFPSGLYYIELNKVINATQKVKDFIAKQLD